MSYHRHSARSLGRIGGGDRALCTTQGYVATGADISEAGASPYQVKGDPVVALIAQLNRFAGKTVSPSSHCTSRNYLPGGPLPLASSLSLHAATIANLIATDRYNCAPTGTYSKAKALWITNGSDGKEVAFATANLAELTITIAQFADSLGLPAATVGITERDPKMTPKMPVVTIAVVGVLAIVAVAMSRRK